MKTSDEQLLAAVPVHASRWQADEGGRVQLIQERVRHRLLKKLVAALGRSDDFHIRLDEVGSAAWLACDGEQSVAAIAASLRARFGAAVEPAERRTATFFVQLQRNRFVTLLVPAPPPAP